MDISKFFRRFRILAFAFQKFLGGLVFSVRNSCVLRAFSVRFPCVFRSFCFRFPFILLSFSVRFTFIRLSKIYQINLKSFTIMRHAIITLPLHLWQAICNGSKHFECRKVIPKIQPFSSRVYVVIKGTNFVAGFFTISGIIGSDDAEYLWEYCAGNLAVTKGWFMNYAATMRKLIFAWEIDSVYQYSGYIDITEYFYINRNPQSIVYTNFETYIPGCMVRGSKHTTLFLQRNEVMPISLYYRGSWYDNIPEKINDESELKKAVQ